MWRDWLRNNEVLVALIIIGLSIVIGVANPAYFSVNNLFGILRSSVVMGLLALGVLVVLISGGIDVSFPAIAVFSLYLTTKTLVGIDFQGSVLVAFAMAGLIGLGLGLINAIFISLFRLPTLIVTLGTLSLYRGFLLFFVGSRYIRDIPHGMAEFSKTNLVTVTTASGSLTNLHVSVLILAGFTLLTWAVLRYTMLGRGIYALGGDREAAERAGFNIRRIEFIIYGYVGLLSGIAGLIFGSLLRQANPFSIVGVELNVIAAVVLGGASIMGGRGTVIGTLLGVLLITIVNNSLILIGIPSDWQKVVIGILILIGTGVPAIQGRTKKQRRLTTATTT